ncbi:putative transposase [Geoalkalibacter ferrihydriticus]|uniref:Putative transposase n=1 Tax=Geoalkalibacter ferrihydriticus TaxID=392333 RepID=A0A1G9TY70_9BACT|nr:putative transposase [Geoalkalibacter ferrihydriticus]
MARANRHYVPGCIWHITHRCHKKEFLLKFAHDRNRFVFWLGEARKRYGLQILNYVVTSNHVHLLVRDQGTANCIPSAMQLLAGRTGQEYNQRKQRKGAFWEDRYHATAIESGEHLLRCSVYIDLNMVRAGAVSHPEEWRHGGYLEIQGRRRRNRLLDLDVLASSVGIGTLTALAEVHKEWVKEALRTNDLGRNEAWAKALLSVARRLFSGHRIGSARVAKTATLKDRAIFSFSVNQKRAMATISPRKISL